MGDHYSILIIRLVKKEMFCMLYGLAIIMLIVSLVLSANVNDKFKKWSEHPNSLGLTGADVAQRMLHQNGIYDVKVVTSEDDKLSDHYDPKKKTVCLSADVYHRASIASVAVAAHECGHAIQHNTGYAPLSIRSALVPVANFGSIAGVWICIIGAILGSVFWPALWLIDIGILFFAFAVIFHLITLPVEYNASNRALATLEGSGMLTSDETAGAKEVLSAAALTYVAAALSAVIQLLRFIGIRRN